MPMDNTTVAITRRSGGKTVTYRVPINEAVSRPEAAALLRLSLRQIYRLIEAARLPTVHERGDIHIPVRALLEYREAHSRLSRAASPNRQHRLTAQMRQGPRAASRPPENQN